MLDEVDAASGARCDWGRDADGDDGAAGTVKRGSKTNQRKGGWHGRKSIFFMVFPASMALCRSIRRRVRGTGGLAVGAHCNQVGLDCGHHGLEVNEPLRWA